MPSAARWRSGCDSEVNQAPSTTVWVTRDEPENGPLSTALRCARRAVVLEPVITRQLLDPLPAELQQLGPTDWLVLTSRFAIDAIPDTVALIPRIAVVGEKSQRAALDRGMRVQLVAPDSTARGLFDRLSRDYSGEHVCYPRSSRSEAPAVPDGLDVSCPILYETAIREYQRDAVTQVDVIALASPSAVAGVGTTALPCACIGPTTSAALRAAGMEPWLEAPQADFASLAQAIADHSRNQRA